MKNPTSQVIASYIQNAKKIRFDAMVSGAKAISGVILELCNEDISDTEKIKKIKDFCKNGLGIPKEEGDK